MAVFLTSLVLFMGVGFLSPRVYSVKSSIYIHKKIPDVNSEMNLPEFKIPNLTDHVRIMKSDMVLEPVARELHKNHPGYGISTASQLSERLRVVSSLNTKIIDINLQHNNPKAGAKILQSVLDQYEIALKDIGKETSLNFLNKRLATVQTEREELESQLEVLHTKTGTTDVRSKNNTLLAMDTSYQQRLSELNGKVASARRSVKELEKTLGMKPEDVKVFARINQDPQIKIWQNDLGRLKAELSDLRSVYTDKYSAVQEKNRAIMQVENLIENKVQEIVGKPLGKGSATQDKLTYSEIDQVLGRDLLNQNVMLIGLTGEQAYYRNLTKNLQGEFNELASSSRKIEDIAFRIATLKAEESKILDRLQDGSIEQVIVENLGSFTVISKPEAPAAEDYIFPMKPGFTIVGGLIVSLLFTLFAVVLSEYVSPRVVSLNDMPVLAKIATVGKRLSNAELKKVYQSVALAVNQFGYKAVTLLHLCGASDNGARPHPCKGHDLSYMACPYSTGVFARQLATMFSERNMKTLLVDCSEFFEQDEEAREVIEQLPDHVLYKYTGMDNLHILSPRGRQIVFFDPYTLKSLPEYASYNLVLLNTSLSESNAITTMVCDAADVTVACVSQSTTPTATVKSFQNIVKSDGINVLGTILFS